MNAHRYPEEFRIEAVKQILEHGHSVADVSRRLGVSTHSLYKWIKLQQIPAAQRLEQARGINENMIGLLRQYFTKSTDLSRWSDCCDDRLNPLGDGAYDTQPVYEAVMRHGAIPIVPPRKRARIRKVAVFAYRN